jgi:hypothetical protein
MLPGSARCSKLDVVRVAAGHRFPAPEMDRMLEEIERGYLADALH